jgi:hypothetical protein
MSFIQRERNENLCKLVFCKYIVRNGKRIYPKKAKVFCFWVPVDQDKPAA